MVTVAKGEVSVGLDVGTRSYEITPERIEDYLEALDDPHPSDTGPSPAGVPKTPPRPSTSPDTPEPKARSRTLKYGPAFPDRFDPILHSRTWGQAFFPWYNSEHRHSGIGLMTPATVHYGRAEAVHEQRARVLAAAHAANPERFVRGLPQPPKLPTAAWINPPTTREDTH